MDITRWSIPKSDWLHSLQPKMEKLYSQQKQDLELTVAQIMNSLLLNSDLNSQNCGFSNSHVWMWESDYKESWLPKNWCFWTVVLEDSWRVIWTARRYNQSILKEISPKYSFEGLMLKLTPILWPYDVKSWLIGKDSDAVRDWGQEEKVTTEDEMAGWHHQLDGHESEWTQGVGDGQGSL